MTRATYNTDNTITELPGPEPTKRFEDLKDYETELKEYRERLAKLRTLPCSPECRGLWKPGDKLEEGKDYELRLHYHAPDDKELTAFPLPVKYEDDLWYKAIDLIMVAHDKGLSKEDAVGVVKSQFIITKR